MRRAALTASLAESGTPALVLCHISHVYPTGASMYFTVVVAQRGNPIEQWRKAKAAASDAMMRTGGTITHHHAVGADHLDLALVRPDSYRPTGERQVVPSSSIASSATCVLESLVRSTTGSHPCVAASRPAYTRRAS